MILTRFLDQRVICLLFASLMIILALALRFQLISYESRDLIIFLLPWMREIRVHGGFGALAESLSNYNPPYLYLLALSSYLSPNLHDTILVKLPSLAGDFFAAFLLAKFVGLDYPTHKQRCVTFAIALLLPTVVLNSAVWGQSDILYTSFLIACVYYYAREQPWLAAACFGIAVGFKLQALFLAPFLLWTTLRRTNGWCALMIAPCAFLATLMPAVFTGRSLGEILRIYPGQAATYHRLTMHCPNLYQWVPNKFYDLFMPAGFIVTTSVILILTMMIAQRRGVLSPAEIVHLALLSVLACVFLLPKMHDRYYFSADLLSLLYAFYFPRYFVVAIVVNLVSLSVYLRYLFGTQLWSSETGALFIFALLVFLVWHYFTDTQACKDISL